MNNQFSYKKGINDLGTLYPALSQQWDTAKNGSLTPADVMPGTARKVYWVCEKGHSWKAVVSSRVSGKGCPYCAGRKVMPGFNDLLSQNPELAKEWDYDQNKELRPEHVTSYSHKKVWWKDKYGHSYEATVANRSNGTGCPYCSGRIILAGFNDLASARPDMCREWNYSRNENTPDEVAPWSGKKVWWKCKEGHEWQASIRDRTRGNNCPYCSNRRPVKGINDFVTMNPDLMQEWNYDKNKDLNPGKITYQSRKKAWWKCKKGHEWQAEVYERRCKGTGCPICAREISRHPVIMGVDDLATIRPDLAAEWDYNRNETCPEEYKTQSNKRVWWKCSKGHCWRSAIQGRVNGKGCPKCMGKTPVRGHIV